jgi:hypothetical protein
MRHIPACASFLVLGAIFAAPASADVIYNNLTPNNAMAIASRPGSPGVFEIEAADDFVVGAPTTLINTASFVGLLVPGAGAFSVSSVIVEIYRVFPKDSNTVRTPNVPTRANSPSDDAFATRGDTPAELTFGTSVLNATFTAANTVQPGGIHPSPLQTTGGNGALTGQEVEFDVTFTIPFSLPADHYFFVPQVTLTNGAQFYWLSASRPISGAGTTPFPAGVTDLQAWTRDAGLDPDWLRVGMDIVGGATPPAFNAAFALNGTAIPEPSSIVLLVSALAMIGVSRRRAAP